MCLSLASLQSSLGFIGPPLLARAQGSLRGPRSLFLHRNVATLTGQQCRSMAAVVRASGGQAEAGAVAASCQLQVEQFPCLSDNYGYLIHDSVSGETAAIDTPDADAYMEALARRGWKLTQIWNTHHHHDHAGGNKQLKDATGCKVVGPEGEADKIPGIDVAVGGGRVVALGTLEAAVIDVGGHTKGHIAFHFPTLGKAFVGDALFAMGCGRMFEGTYEQMFASIQRLRALPDETTVYCAHEYTLANAKFALSVEPSNSALQARAELVRQQRAKGTWTVPTQMAIERETNPFLRFDSSEIRSKLGVVDASDLDAFAAIRKAKDRF